MQLGNEPQLFTQTHTHTHPAAVIYPHTHTHTGQARGAPLSYTLTLSFPKMDFESRVLPHTGGFGRYNRLVCFFSWMPSLAVSLNLLSDLLFTLPPDSYRCRTDTNLSAQDVLNYTVPWMEGSGPTHCQQYRYYPNRSSSAREPVPCTLGWEFTPAAGLRSNYVTEWSLVCDSYWKVPLQHICFMLGWIAGYLVLGTLCDRFGRRRSFLVSVLLSAVLGASVCLSNTPIVYLLLRLGQGATLSGVFLSAYIIRVEMCDPPHRLMVTMVGGFFGVLAELLLPGLALLCRDWPVLQAVATLPLLLLISYWCSSYVFPESPRWLLATSQFPEAKKLLQNISTRNGVSLNEEVYPAEALLPELDVPFTEDSQPLFHNILELRHTRIIWKNCLILGFTLFIGTGIQYCFTRNLHSFSPNFYFGYFLRVGTGALACALLCLTVDRMGRRAVLLLAAIITGLSSLLLLALTQYLQGGLVLVLSLLGLLTSQALAMLSVFFACEVIPTVVRGGALGLVLAAGCVGMAASSLMELQDNGGYFLHHVVFSSFAVLSVLCVMLLPESKRKPLPDSLKDGESQRRPPLFLSRGDRDALPLLRSPGQASEYDPDTYSRLVNATKKMLTKESVPYKVAVPPQRPLLAKGGTGTLQEDSP